eukprot:TRINITY_DN55_c0_g1_i9.p1 TRINITY_DN55_c0_g1~~TRINITY_DN55_c0_g1_i9.p1  ORF type:complete len:236 (+),score=92.84 TRINITY_DN55_c0_g1_i9:62-709(+)
MSPVHFTYFGIMAKGFGPALTLESHGVDWKATSLALEGWGPLKESGKCPFGQVPILETEEYGVIAQSTAIMQYVGRVKEGAAGANIAEGIISDQLLGLADDFFAGLSKVQPTIFVKEKAPADQVKAHWAEAVPKMLTYLEAFTKGKDAFTSSGITVGELSLWAVLHQMVLIEPPCLNAFPNTKAFYTRILNLPATQKVIKGESPVGNLPAYFLPN